METPDVLLVEDDKDLREEVATFLRFRQFAVRECGHLSEAHDAVRRQAPQAAIIDVMLPDGSGIALLDTLRTHAPGCAAVMLSARGEIDVKLDAYNAGADNYLVKPIDLRELAALVSAAVRRQPAESPTSSWYLETGTLQATSPSGDSVTLTLQESSLMSTLALSKGHFASRRDLIEALGHDYFRYDEQRLEALVSRLRKKLAPIGGNPLKAAHGKGYVFTHRLEVR